MSSSSTPRTLHSLASYQNGRAFRDAETRGSTGLPIVKIAELSRGITSTTGRFDGDVDARHRITSGDLLFAWSGTIAIRRWRGPEAALNQHLFKVTAAEDVDSDYLEYLLLSFVSKFEELVEDQRTTLGHVRVSDLKDLTVVLPPLPEQETIGRALRTFDERIEVNERLVTALERVITARLKAAQLETWPFRPLTDIARFVNGGAFTKGASGEGRIVVRIREMNSGISASTVFSEIRVPLDQEVDRGDILFAWSGSLGVDRWRGPNAIVNQHIFKVIPERTPAWFVYSSLQEAMPEFRAIARDKATTMGHIQRFHLQERQVPVPEEGDMRKLDDELGSAWRTIVAAEAESDSLKALRGVLIPELVGGRVRLNAPTVQVGSNGAG